MASEVVTLSFFIGFIIVVVLFVLYDSFNYKSGYVIKKTYKDLRKLKWVMTKDFLYGYSTISDNDKKDIAVTYSFRNNYFKLKSNIYIDNNDFYSLFNAYWQYKYSKWIRDNVIDNLAID